MQNKNNKHVIKYTQMQNNANTCQQIQNTTTKCKQQQTNATNAKQLKSEKIQKYVKQYKTNEKQCNTIKQSAYKLKKTTKYKQIQQK